MAGKRKRGASKAREDLSKPTAWRLQHGGFSPPSRDADPDTGVVVIHRRAIDLLGKLEANGTISVAMHDAGDSFHMQFRTAVLDTLRAGQMARLPSGEASTPTERIVVARRKIADAMAALGGEHSAAGSCVWHVVGCETSIREWAVRRGWGGRLVGHAQAQGILVAALGVLAGHYGLETTSSSQQRSHRGVAKSDSNV